jgi:hypothetical protein
MKSTRFRSLEVEDKQMARTTYLDLRVLAITVAVALAACLLVLVDAKLVWAAPVSFTAAQSVGVGDSPEAVVSVDFNSDSKADLATANLFADNVSVRLGNGDGTFAAAQNFSVGDGPLHLTSGNFNADTKADLAVANVYSDTVSVLLGNGDGTFAAAQNFGAGDATWFVASADLNGDSKADLATANAPSISFIPGAGGGAGNVSVLLGNGDGTFKTAQNFAAGINPASIVGRCSTTILRWISR